MDDIVKAAMSKWPNVPHCYGWLGLDARGNWYMRDDRAQVAGPFCAPSSEPGRQLASKGSLLKHDKLIDFIQRNYAADAQGQWFFQNGPQRVYVELEATPFVWRVGHAPDFEVTSHTNQVAIVQRCFIFVGIFLSFLLEQDTIVVNYLFCSRKFCNLLVRQFSKLLELA